MNNKYIICIGIALIIILIFWNDIKNLLITAPDSEKKLSNTTTNKGTQAQVKNLDTQKTLKVGSKGDEAKELQKLINEGILIYNKNASSVKVDAKNGTVQQVPAKFLQSIVTDGSFGKKTEEMLLTLKETKEISLKNWSLYPAIAPDTIKTPNGYKK